MNSNVRSEYVTRDSVLKLLSDDEMGKVSTAESAKSLTAGDEYLDLEQLERGVQRAGGTAVTMGHVLPRKAVHDNTWNKILTLLKPSA
jgi:hypothetical protein